MGTVNCLVAEEARIMTVTQIGYRFLTDHRLPLHRRPPEG
jgi:hypothetical protein